VELVVVLYRNGVDSYVNVITAQNAFLSARETELQVQLRQLTASVALINALGGGWATTQMDRTERAAMRAPRMIEEAQAPAENGGEAVPNPPPLPLGEIQPDDLIRQNEEAMAPAPASSGAEK
jgi:hypothetical protein